MNNLMKQAQKVQKDLEKSQKELAALILEGSAGGGAITIQIKGDHTVQKVVIDPDLLTEDIEMVQDMLQAAFNQAVEKIKEETDKRMGSFSQSMPGLPNMF
ncbi:hypothetical protein AB834_03405 [PVC group bacterium (ex Bugula neritina AB1)]|nr:hypothetical protein AB834_03405 [PVC group bacterium (ex Bugula neritina AB1)]